MGGAGDEGRGPSAVLGGRSLIEAGERDGDTDLHVAGGTAGEGTEWRGCPAATRGFATPPPRIDRMDASTHAIPCQTGYPSADEEAYWRR